MGASGTPGTAGVPTPGGSPITPPGSTGGLAVNGSVAPGGNSAGTPADAAANTAAAAATGTALPTVHRRSATDNRRSNKPIMEKRRRARINNCLNELKALILDATKKDPARHSKLEKADILEMTVRHLETLRRQRAALSAAADPSVLNKYKAGFSECAAEVSRFLMRHAADAVVADGSAASSASPSVDQHFKRRLLSHLTHCLNGVSTTENGAPVAASGRQTEPMDDSPSLPPLAPKQSPAAPGGIAPSTQALFAATGLQLLPTRLPNGDLALVLPSQQRTTSPVFRAQQQPPPPPPSTTPSSSCSSSQPASPGSPPPLLAVPAPTFHPSRTASTASCSSTASSSSSSVSPVAFEGPAQPFALTVPRPCPGRVQAVKPVAVVAGSPVAQPGTRGMVEIHAIACTRPQSPSLQKPLSLVVKKVPMEEESKEEEGPWRPW